MKRYVISSNDGKVIKTKTTLAKRIADIVDSNPSQDSNCTYEYFKPDARSVDVGGLILYFHGEYFCIIYFGLHTNTLLSYSIVGTKLHTQYLIKKYGSNYNGKPLLNLLKKISKIKFDIK